MVCNSPADWLHPLSLTCTVAAPRACCGATGFCIIHDNFPSLQNIPFWFIPLDTVMIAQLMYIYQISVSQRISTLRRVEVKERKQNVYTTFFLYQLFVTFIK